MNKKPLDVNVVLNLIMQVLINTQSFLQTAQTADKQYGNEIVEFDKVAEIVEKYRKQKLLYGVEVNGKVFYNFEEVLKINLKNEFSPYDLIEIALALLLTQNRAVVFVKWLNKSYSLDLIINLLIKFADSLKVNENYIEFNRYDARKKIKFDFEFNKVENKIMYERKSLQIEFDYNLFLKSYEIESGENSKKEESKEKVTENKD